MSEVIRIDSVTKSFDLSAKSFNSLKEKVLLRKHKNSKSDFLAVNDVNIAVKEGETVGLIGHNGSGKSTLLKCVAGVLRPTSGRISTRGRLAALLELGAGMEPDLTARENIYLNGSLLGFSKKQIDTKFDEIIYFSELEKFIDTQVRFYSSGMQVRLGFSVAINVDPDILLIDEVLAVGDESFQRKCMSKIKSFQKEGKTIFFVSHSVDQVREICDRTVVMHHGSVLYDGDLSEGVRTYRETLLADEEKYREESSFTEESSMPDSVAKKYDKKVKMVSVEYLDAQGKSLKNFKTGEEINVKFNFETLEELKDHSFSIQILNNKDQMLFYTNSVIADMVSEKTLDGKHSAVFKIKSIPFNEGDYFVTFGVVKTDSSRVYYWGEKVSHFGVTSDGRSQGIVELNCVIEVE